MRIAFLCLTMLTPAFASFHDIVLNPPQQRTLHAITLNMDRGTHLFQLWELDGVHKEYNRLEIHVLGSTHDWRSHALMTLNPRDHEHIEELFNRSLLLPINAAAGARTFTGNFATVGFYVPNYARVRVIAW